MKGKKTGGRKKGTPNKKDATIREFLTGIFDANRETIIQDVAGLDPAERLAFLVKLLPYIAPKMATIETTIKTDELTDDQITDVCGRLRASIDGEC